MQFDRSQIALRSTQYLRHIRRRELDVSSKLLFMCIFFTGWAPSGMEGAKKMEEGLQQHTKECTARPNVELRSAPKPPRVPLLDAPAPGRSWPRTR